MRKVRPAQLPEPLEGLRKHLTSRWPERHGIVPRCRGEHGCRLHLPSQSLCIKCDRSDLFGRNDPKPDCVLATRDPEDNERLLWVIVEMTIGTKEPDDVLGQLQAGADAIGSHRLTRLLVGTLVPIYLQGRGNKHAATRLVFDQKRLRVTSGEDRLRVLTGECGASLADILTDNA